MLMVCGSLASYAAALVASAMRLRVGRSAPSPKAMVNTRTGLTRFLPAVLSGEFEEAEVEMVSWQGSGDVAAAARANCYLVVPPEAERLAVGEMVSILMR